MIPRPASPPSSSPTRPLSAWLAGRIDWPGYARMAERLAGEAALSGGRHPTLVVFELEPCITIGRLGSRADVLMADEELQSRRLPLRFTGRGGGAVAHGPGQVCVSLFASLDDPALGGMTWEPASTDSNGGLRRHCGRSRPGPSGIRAAAGSSAGRGFWRRWGWPSAGAWSPTGPS